MHNVTDLADKRGGAPGRPARARVPRGWTLVSEFDHEGKQYALLVRTAGPLRLTPREREVITRACVGQTNKVIAFDLAVSDSTVRVFMTRICAKLGVKTRAEAVAAYRARPHRTDERKSSP